MTTVRCTNHRSEAVQYVTTHGRDIVTSTRPLWIKYKAHAIEIPPSEYPPHVRALKPVQVFVNEKGVTMYIYSVYWNVTGIYIRYDPAFDPPSTLPPDSVETRYERLAPDLYWFSRPR
jgi:hypothetical protein